MKVVLLWGDNNKQADTHIRESRVNSSQYTPAGDILDNMTYIVPEVAPCSAPPARTRQ
jgi:hypothetical protein